MKTPAFFASHPVFRAEDFGKHLDPKGPNVRTRDSLLRHYVKAGRLVRVRRPIYAVVPEGSQAGKFQVDPYLVASRILPGAVIAYHAALQLRGHASTVWSTYPVLVRRQVPSLAFQGFNVQGVVVPAALRRRKAQRLGVETLDRQGLDLEACTLERSLVDCLDRPDLGGDWEEVWKSFASVPYLKVEAVVEYALRLGKAVTAAKTGYFLELNRERWDVGESHLAALKKASPSRLTYMDLAAKGRSTTVAAWRLLVPTAIQERAWEEPR